MKEILGDKFVFNTSTKITNKGLGTKRSVNKTHDNVLVIRNPDFNNFLDIINGVEEIEEIKFKLKKNSGK
jgi:hypothetical protein